MVRRIEAHSIIGDHERAIEEAVVGLKLAPHSEALYRAYIVALSKGGRDLEAAKAFKQLGVEDHDLCEQVAWSAINRGAISDAMPTRLAATIGAVVTRDIQAVRVLVHHMRSRSAVMRAAAVELAPQFQDEPLKVEIEHLMREDGNWQVRLAAIEAAGVLEMHRAIPQLEKVIASSRSTAEEKLAAIASIVNLLDEVDSAHLKLLATHKRAGLRHLACKIVEHLECDTDVVVPLLNDPIPAVRKAAIRTLGLMGVKEEGVWECLHDRNNSVAITAAWYVTLQDPQEGRRHLERWLTKGRPFEMRLAAGALVRTGSSGVPLMEEMLGAEDPYVRINVAMGLIGQRVNTGAAADAIYEVFVQENGQWMFDEGDFFRTLCPSKVRHGGAIPNRPEVINQLTRLQVLTMLAVVEHPKAQDAIKSFLSTRAWGITGLAAVTLVEEGDAAALEIVCSLLEDPDPKIRVQAALAMAIWGKDPSAVRTLEEAYPSADRTLKIHILEALGHIGARESIPFLLENLDEPFATLRIFAASSLIKCINS